MHFVDGPAVLAGLMMCVALMAWTIGRLQGAVAPAENARARATGESHPLPRRIGLSPMAVSPCQNAVRQEHITAPDTPDALAELHAEITAYRHAEQVLSGPEAKLLLLDPAAARARVDCRYLGIVDPSTCGLPRHWRVANGCEPSCMVAAVLPRQRAVQPSPAAPGLMRE